MCGCALSSCLREYGREMHCECAVCVRVAINAWLGCNFQNLMRLYWVELGSTPVWRVAGARRAKGHGEAEPSMQTCKPQCLRALQPHGKCENGLRCVSNSTQDTASRAGDMPRGS